MIDMTQKVMTIWNNGTKRDYINKGYKFTKTGDEFNVILKDVPLGSTIKVKAVCDFCGQVYYPIYKNYVRNHTKHGNDCCKKCSYIRAKETSLAKYGVAHYSQTEQCKSGKRERCLAYYGVENPSQSEEIQAKKRQTNLNNFGTEWFTQSSEFKVQCMDKYGVDNPMKSSLIQERAVQTLKANGNAPTSKEELCLAKIIEDIYGASKCKRGVNVGRCVLDIELELNNVKIDVEYDGAYWHNNRKQYDRRRDEVMKKMGYKILRVLSNGIMPTQTQLTTAIDKLLNTERTFTCIDLT